MKGYELTFMAPRSRRHHGESVLDAVVRIAKAHGVTRHTRRTDTESIGVGGQSHSAHFFELADEPEEVSFILVNGKTDELMQAIDAEGLYVFCIRREIEFFQFGADAAAAPEGSDHGHP